MSVVPTTAPETTSAKSKSMSQRVASFGRGEMRMLLRNRTALFSVIALPIFVLAMIAAGGGLRQDGMDFGNGMLLAGIMLAIPYSLYYNLVGTYVARREGYVLKRMRSGPVSDLGTLIASSLPSLVLVVVQIALILLALVAVGHPPTLTNPVALILACLLGVGAFVGLAMMSTGFTKTVEMAQVTTFPIVMGTMAFSGVFFPLTAFPDQVANLIYLTPGAAMTDLINLGLSGTTRTGEVVAAAQTWRELVRPIVTLAVWTYLGVYYVKKHFAWEPRR